MDKKRVILVTGSLCDGGAEKVMSILASGCDALGADVKLVVLRNKQRAYPVSDGVKIVQFSETGKFITIRRIMRLHKVLKESDADAIIVFMPIISLYTLIANIGVGKKIIMSERTNPRVNLDNAPLKVKVAHFFMRKCEGFSMADWMVFQTPDAQSYYSSRLQKKSSIIPNPLDTIALPSRYEGMREKRIVAAGRFSEEKNFKLLIDGFSIFHKDFPEYSLTIYGEGALRNSYEEQIKTLGLEQYITLPGFVTNLSQEINRAAMYISTSNNEGISNAILEALGMGIPTIATDCPVGGSRMFVHTDINGILIPMNCVNELVKAMRRIAADEEYAQKLSLNAEKVRDELEIKNISKQWLDLV